MYHHVLRADSGRKIGTSLRALAVAGAMLLFPASFAFAQVSPSLSIQSLSPGTTVGVGNEVSFNVIPVGFNGAQTYSVSDSMSGSSVTSADINSNGVFAWVPTQSDVGTHTITIMANDSSGDASSVTQQITVTGPTGVTIQSVSPSGGTVAVGSPVSFTAVASGYTNPTYSVGDTFSGTSLTNSNIGSNGYFTWTPTSSDIGAHTVTIVASDSLGHTGSASQTFTVTSSSSANASIQSISPGTSVMPNQALTFSVVPSGLTNPTYAVSDSFGGSSVTSADINSGGMFAWTPTSNDVGTHTITITATDSSGHTSSISQQFTVGSGRSLTVGTITPGTSVNAGSAATFVVTPSGFVSAPTYNVSDSFGGSSASTADINANGVFLWTPTAGDIGTHTITITGTDSSGMSASVPLTFSVGSGAGTTVAAAPAYVFTESLSVGSTGADVTALQNFLAAKGYMTVSATGYYGPVTRAAVAKFQSDNGIEAVGIVGPQTRGVLNQMSSTSGSASVSRAQQLQALEAELVQLEAELAALQAAQH